MQKLFGLLAAAHAADWDYSQNGADWPNIAGYEACAATNQSPIDLKTDTSGYKKFKASDDDITKIYSNQKASTVNWNGHTSQTNLAQEIVAGSTDVTKYLTTNFFKSKIAGSHFGGPEVFEGS